MSDDQQQQQAEAQRRRGMPQFDPRQFDPRNFDPRQAMNPAAYERMLQAQATARAQASAATTIVVATLVSLVTSAFSFVAALAWNDAIQGLLNDAVLSPNGILGGMHLTPTQGKLIYAALVTVVAVIVVIIMNRVARRIARNSVIAA